MANEPDDRDSPWKEALDRYFEPFLRLLFSAVHELVDWSRGWIALDAELQQVVRDAETGRRLADKLFQVWLKDGGEAWVPVHVEVQGQVDPALPERVFVYHYRIFDRHRRPVVSVVVLADDRPDWRPDRFERELAGCRLELVFPRVKLLDLEDRLPELEADPNPFAVVVLAHLASLRTRKDPAARLEWKWRLVARMLRERGHDRQEIQELFRFVDWLLALPPELERELVGRVKGMGEEKQVPHVTYFERMLEQEAHQKAILRLLGKKFGPVPDEVVTRVRAIADPAAIEDLLDRALAANSLDDLFPPPTPAPGEP